MKAPSRLTAIASTAVVCFAATSVGNAIALAGAQELLVRPATGVTLSLLLLLGVEVWPGVLAGVFLAAITAHDPALVALATAAGIAIEAVVAARLLRRFAGLDRTLDTVRQAMGLVVLGAVASTTIGATTGVAGLCAGGVRPWAAFGQSWCSWWLGSAIGDLVVVPALLTWHAWLDAPRRRIVETALLLIGLALTSGAIFAGPFSAAASSRYSLDYIVFPFLIGA